MKPTFYVEAGTFFNEDFADWSRAVMPIGIRPRRYAVIFPTPRESGQDPLPRFPRTIEWLHKAEVAMIGVDEGWLAGRMTGAIISGGEDEGKEQEAAGGATEDGQTICAFFAKKHRADGSCSSMDARGFCHYVHTDKFGKIDKEGPRKKDRAKARMIGTCPKEEGG